jgi:hypothetical protein
MIEIKFDKQKLKAIERQLAAVPRALPKVMSRALNRTATSARTATSRSLATQTGLKVKDVRSRIHIERASYSHWRSAIRISTKRLGLLAFRARQTKRGVSYRSGSGRETIGHAFIAVMSSGHRGVFKRKTAARLPIVELHGPSLAQVFVDAESESRRLYSEALAKLNRNVADQVRLIVQRRWPR